MFYTPPTEFIETLQKIINDLLVENPAATSSEQFLQHHVEFELMKININEIFYENWNKLSWSKGSAYWSRQQKEN